MARIPENNFSKPVRETLANRVGSLCSNPNCRKMTSGPSSDPTRAMNLGEAAHITAASPGWARYDESLSTEQRSSIDNGIWLCGVCAHLVDHDEQRFTVELLRQWREQAEEFAKQRINAGSKFRPIAFSETRHEMTIGEIVGIRELEEEFGCHVQTNLHVPAGDGAIRLDAAVVRGEDLIAIELREKGFAYFQIDYLLELCETVKFHRFRSCVLYLVLVSNEPPESDAEVERRLRELTAKSKVETHIRLFRLNTLRAKFGL